MLTNLIEYRGKEFSNLIKIGDYLARALRENVELFYVEDGVATYLTESGSVVSGKYTFKPTLKLNKVVVEDSSILEDRKAYESVTDKKILSMLSNLLEDDYQEAEGSFDQILSMFETKLAYERIKGRLQEKTQRFGEQTKIVSSKEFQRVNEVRDQIVALLKENKDILKNSGIKNGMKLTTLVSTSFDLPKITVDQLKENKEFTVRTTGKSSLYEHLCRKELIQKELLEAKENFDRVWIDNTEIQDLASMIFEESEDVVRHQVAKVVSNIPYFALSTKKQLSNLIRNSLSMNEIKVKNVDINSFAGVIFEMKKPVKKYVLDILNEKYGIDVTKLSEVPTFRTLLMTEAEILLSISRYAPKNSVIKSTLVELANSLTLKNGAESIDLADFLSELFVDAEATDALNEASLMDYMDFTKVADDLGKIGQILKMIVPAVEKAADSVETHGEDMSGGEKPEAPEASYEEEPKEPQDPLGSPDPMDSDSEAPAMDAETAADEVKDEVDQQAKDSAGEQPIPQEEDMPEEGMEDEEDEGIPDEEPEEMEQDDLTALLSKIEDLLADISPDEEESDEEDFEEPGEEEEEEEEEYEEDEELDPEQYKS